MRKTLVSLVVLAASVAVAQADPLKVKVGAASIQGEVSFTLSVPPPAGTDLDAETVAVIAYVAGETSAQDKVLAIHEAVANAGVAGTWRAVSAAGATSMSFEHLVGEAWTAVESITALVDTTGAGTQLVTNQLVGFSLDIDPAAVAFGTDANGGPSFMTVSVTNTLTFTKAIQMGDTAETLVGEFEAFLIAQAAEGVAVERTGPTSLNVRLDSTSNAAINLQVTDAGLANLATASAFVGLSLDAQVIDR